NVGTVPLLITVECRDRVATEDVRWIEQLAEKQRSLGASVTLAVSSSGFGDPAIKKAEACGIQVRTLTDATADDFLNWLKFQAVDLVVNEWQFDGLDIELYDVPDDAELPVVFHDLVRQHGVNAPIFIRNSDGHRFSVQNLLIEWQKRNGSFFPDAIPHDG